MYGRSLRAIGPLMVVVLALLVTAGVATAAAPRRLTQITPSTQSSNPTMMTDVNGVKYFIATDGSGLRHLWRTDGTEAGTKRLSPDLFEANNLTAVGNKLYFAAHDGIHGNELWESDGTEAGTKIAKETGTGNEGSVPSQLRVVGTTLFYVVGVDAVNGSELWKVDAGGEPELVLDLNPGPESSYPGGFTTFEGRLYFSATDPDHGTEPWVSDGTKAGTEIVSDIFPGPEGSSANGFTSFGGALYFSARDEAHGYELWTLDGGGEPQLVKDIYPGPEPSYAGGLMVAGGTLYFQAQDETHGYELWTTDGTEVGTQLLKDINPTSSTFISGFVAVGSTLYFTADDGSHGEEIWSSDGTETGTTMVKDINPTAAEGSFPSQFTPVGSTLYFTADDGSHGQELWRSDGTEVGTAMVKDINPTAAEPSFPSQFTPVGSTLYFTADDGSHGQELWRSDGTETGTTMVKDLNPSAGSPPPVILGAGGGALYLSGEEHGFGTELLISDGTEVGTHMVKDINALPQFEMSEITSAGSLVYFTAEDRVEDLGQELWVSDGTAAGTKMVKDIGPGPEGSRPHELINVNGTLYFIVNTASPGEQLWTSDGTEGGTHLVMNFEVGFFNTVNELANFQGTLFFAADDGVHGGELWKSDGTEDGTEMVKDIYSGPNSSTVLELSDVGGALMFSANDEAHGQELWTSDGTEEGTHLLKDINPGQGSSGPRWRYPQIVTRRLYGTPLYFGADDGEHGFELWKTDGTEAGTTLLKDINPGLTGSFVIAGFLRFESLTFFVTTTPEYGFEPWQTDGTEAGTRLAKDISPGPLSSTPSDREVAKGIIYFPAEDGAHGYELWRSDGTVAGTEMVKDINAGSAGSFFGVGRLGPITNLNGEIYFAADDGIDGRELWRSDGTEATTLQFADLNPGPASSTPQGLVATNGSLYFSAEDSTGRQLWALDAPVPDTDGDGIANEIDTKPTEASDSFFDGAATEGTIVDRAGLEVKVTDAPVVDGVHIKVGPGAGEVEIAACAGFTLRVKAGTEADVTCGSIRVEVVTGEAEVVLEDGETVVFVPAGVSAKVSEGEDGSFKIENLGGGDVTVTTEGEETTLQPGDPPLVLEPPVAVADKPTVNEDAAVTPIDVLANDTDSDGGEMSIVSKTDASHGTVAITGGGTGITYQPTADYCGADSFTYTLNGGSSATVAVTVTCLDDAPAAVNDSAALNEDAAATAIPVLGNDTDGDGGAKSIASAGGAGHGTVAITGGGTGLTYAPAPNYCGPDYFTYTLNGGSSATVSLTVACVDDPPIALRDSLTIREDSGKAKIKVLVNDTDSDGGPIAIASVTKPHHGKASIKGAAIDYKPKHDFCGKDSFAYALNGGASAAIAVKVKCRPH